MRAVAAVFVAGTLVMASCGVGGSAAAPKAVATASATAVASRVVVTLGDFSVATDRASVPAGEVTFVVRNDGKIPHEFVVVQSDLEPLKLPTKFEKEIDASKVTVLGKSDEFDGGGKTIERALRLERGKYVLLCNVPAHYVTGMAAGFRVE